MTTEVATTEQAPEEATPESQNCLPNEAVEDMEDSVERLFKKFLWALVPGEFYQEDSNRPITEVREIYYKAIEVSTERLVGEIKSEINDVIVKLQQADRMTDLKKRLDAAFQDGDLETLEEIASVLESKGA